MLHLLHLYIIIIIAHAGFGWLCVRRINGLSASATNVFDWRPLTRLTIAWLLFYLCAPASHAAFAGDRTGTVHLNICGTALLANRNNENANMRITCDDYYVKSTSSIWTRCPEHCIRSSASWIWTKWTPMIKLALRWFYKGLQGPHPVLIFKYLLFVSVVKKIVTPTWNLILPTCLNNQQSNKADATIRPRTRGGKT